MYKITPKITFFTTIVIISALLCSKSVFCMPPPKLADHFSLGAVMRQFFEADKVQPTAQLEHLIKNDELDTGAVPSVAFSDAEIKQNLQLTNDYKLLDSIVYPTILTSELDERTVAIYQERARSGLNEKFIIPTVIAGTWYALMVEITGTNIVTRFVNPTGAKLDYMRANFKRKLQGAFPASKNFTLEFSDVFSEQNHPYAGDNKADQGPFLVDALNFIMLHGTIPDYSSIYTNVTKSNIVKAAIAFGQDVRKSQLAGRPVCTSTPLVNQQKRDNFNQISRIATEEEREIDLRVYPVNAHQVDLSHTKTYGDMHGNAMKVLWSLIDCGAAIMTPTDFQAMWAIYDTYWYYVDSQEVKIALADFEQLLTRITFIPGANIRFLGDMMADRGDCDYLTLKILAKAITDKVNVEILLSNHDSTLLINYANFYGDFICSSGFYNSFTTLFKLIKNNLITQAEVKQLVEICYFNQENLKLVSYCLSKDKQKIAIFMHAPNYFEVIYALADQFKCPYVKCDNAQALAQLIDQINAKFHQLTIEQRVELIKKSTHNVRVLISNKSDAEIIKKDPLAMIMYNANYNFFHVPVVEGEWPQFLSGIFHGHTDIEAKDIIAKYSMKPNYLTLLNMLHCYDDALGKYDRVATHRALILAPEYTRVVMLDPTVDIKNYTYLGDDLTLQEQNGELFVFRLKNKNSATFCKNIYKAGYFTELLALARQTGIKPNDAKILFINTDKDLIEKIAAKFNLILNQQLLLKTCANLQIGTQEEMNNGQGSMPIILPDYSFYLMHNHDQNMTDKEWRQIIHNDLDAQQILFNAYVYRYDVFNQCMYCLRIDNGVMTETIKITANKGYELSKIIDNLSLNPQSLTQHQKLNSAMATRLVLSTTSSTLLIDVYYIGLVHAIELRHYQLIRNIIDNDNIYPQAAPKHLDGRYVFCVSLAKNNKSKLELQYLIERFDALNSNKNKLLVLKTAEHLSLKNEIKLEPEQKLKLEEKKLEPELEE